MTSKIKVDNVNKVSDDSNIIKKCGTTTTIGSGASNPIVVDGSAVTIGRCGGTVALASGASQTGFGRTGTVDWQTGSIKTATFTGENGKGYFVNTTGGVVTANLPASPTAGDIMAVSDYAQTATTNNITIGRNGSNIQGDASDLVISRNGVAFTLVFVDATKGWVVTDSGAEADKAAEAEFIQATGGTITTCGNFKIHTFTGPGTFTVCSVGNPTGSTAVDYLVVAGGGGGAGGVGGGGGAGGFRLANSVGCIPAPTMSPLVAPNSPNPAAIPVTATAFPIAVGGGGAGAPAGSPEFSGTEGCNGAVSTFSTITSTGGGGGARRGSGQNAGSGGSGGGGAGEVATCGPQRQGGAGNTPPVSPSQGNNGGIGGISPSYRASGGGGGAAAVGTGACGTQTAGPGGIGTFVSPLMAGSNGTTGPVPSVRYFAGGGGGGTESSPSLGLGSNGAGGAGGGGSGGPGPTAIGSGVSGTVNSGGGGGGASRYNCPSGRPSTRTGGTGGSGIVIIRYKFQ